MPQTRCSLCSELGSRRLASFGSRNAAVLVRMIGQIGGIEHHQKTGGRGWIDLPEGLNDPDLVAAT